MRQIACLLVLATLLGCRAATAQPTAVRAMTFNLEDVRTSDLLHGDNPRLRHMAEIIQRIRPNILLLNEIAYDEADGPYVPEGAAPGQNAQRFVEQYLAVPQAEGLEPMLFKTFMQPSNTGRLSGFDLNRDGVIASTYPEVDLSAPDGTPAPQTPDGRTYGNDSWGFGTFPGQYAMALLVDPRLTIEADLARTFRLFPWSYLPDHLMPSVPKDGIQASEDHEPVDDAWYAGEAGELFRLSSKSFWDVPILMPNGTLLHALVSHPTPPAFDGPEGRNKRRNHDEIRLIADYIEGAAYLVDDLGQPGGLPAGAHFVVMGDLNADPDEGSSMYDPIGRLLLGSPRIHADRPPTSPIAIDGLDADDTARFGLRVDYVLPSAGLRVVQTGQWRGVPGESRDLPSDHFPVWADLIVPDKNETEP